MWVIIWLFSIVVAIILTGFYFQKQSSQQRREQQLEHQKQLHQLNDELAEKEQQLALAQTNQGSDQELLVKIIADTLEESANNVDTTSVEIEQVATLIAELTASLHSINELTSSISQVVGKEEQAIKEINLGLGNSSDSTTELAKIQQKFEDITAITQDISYIGAEAEMLALNAAIEAARAGDAGRGFAVVADNMKALAQKSQESTSRVLTVVDDSEEIIASVVSSFQQRGQTLEGLVTNLIDNFAQISENFALIDQRILAADHNSTTTAEAINQVAAGVKTSVETLVQRLSKLVSAITGKDVIDLSPQQAKAQWQEFDEVIDVRREPEWSDELGHISGVTCSTLQTDFKQYVKSLSPNKRYLFVCRSGGRSTKAAQMAITHGITDVYNLDGGMLAWRAAGF